MMKKITVCLLAMLLPFAASAKVQFTVTNKLPEGMEVTHVGVSPIVGNPKKGDYLNITPYTFALLGPGNTTFSISLTDAGKTGKPGKTIPINATISYQLSDLTSQGTVPACNIAVPIQIVPTTTHWQVVAAGSPDVLTTSLNGYVCYNSGNTVVVKKSQS